MKINKNIQIDTNDFREGLQQELTTYPEKIVNKDGTVTVNQIKNAYFLINDTWNLDFLGEIKQFKKAVENYDQHYKNIKFQFSNPKINLEVKYVFYHRMFNEHWSVSGTFNKQNCLKNVTKFINEKYPNLSSLLELDIDKAESEFRFWLNKNGYRTEKVVKRQYTKEYTTKSTVLALLKTIYSAFYQLSDRREEWEKDRWDVRQLNKLYGINYDKTKNCYYLDFTGISEDIRLQVKRYFKQRLLGKNKFAWGTARTYLASLSRFFSFISSLESTWKDLKTLKRSHMEEFIKYLHQYYKNNATRRDSHPEQSIKRTIQIIQKFLEDIQRYEYDLAPNIHVRLLIFPEDIPKLRKKSIDQIDYIPDYVLEQLFTHIDNLNEDVIPIVWIAFKTGLRISDVLSLTSECLIKLNGQYFIETDIEKTYVKGHRIPIDEQLANILAVLIRRAKKLSNDDNNPEGFIFIRYNGTRKGKPFDQKLISTELNILSKRKNITDENGNVFHFKTHQFRHTYGVKMLNGGADILTVQELLAHASPEMTMRYAKLLDDTKRKAFESIISQGVFSFNLNGEVQEIKPGEDIPTDILDALWQDHKLNAMDNPYGTCHARLNGNCPHIEAPLCLTCGDNKTPCKDLAVGFSELDQQKYELHIKTTTKAIEVAKQRGREDIAEKNEKNLQRYQNILNTLQEGNIIFGRQERMERKLGVQNG